MAKVSFRASRPAMLVSPAPTCRRSRKDEFDAFLECGILAHGFLRLRCGDCGHDKLLAFSCKRRGFCPSCGARRMAQRRRTWWTTSAPKSPRRRQVA